MFHLKEKQLHSVLMLVVVASVTMFCIFGMPGFSANRVKHQFTELEDYSEGWLANYDTRDKDKIDAYQRKVQDRTPKKRVNVVEVMNFPAYAKVEKGKMLLLSKDLPEQLAEPVYICFETKKQQVRVLSDDGLLYESSKKDTREQAYHFVKINKEYAGKRLVMELRNNTGEPIGLESMSLGTFSQVFITYISNERYYIAAAIILFIMCVCMLVVYVLVQNRDRYKIGLLYASLEGIVFSALLLLQGSLIPVLWGANFAIYLVKSCLIILLGMFHLLVVRSQINKKHIFALVDIMILGYAIVYVALMVFETFGLLSFSGMYVGECLLFEATVVVLTIILAVAAVEYKQKEGVPYLLANGLLSIAILVCLFFILTKMPAMSSQICMVIAILIYSVVVCVCAMRRAFYVEPVKQQKDHTEDIRHQVVEQLNPNLLFASFQTLQTLMKKGSARSVKMIYYISVYFRGNLKAIENADEIITFEEELQHIISYLQLQQTRNQNLGFAVECKEKMFRIPRHSIEPMVENAVKHGIAKHGNKGNVVIRTYQREEGYALQVIDDGIGFDLATLKKQNTTLSRTLQKLETVCHAKTEIISKEGKGTVITMVLPMLENDLIEEHDI